MSYWIFKCNPKVFDLEGRLSDPNTQTSWNVTRFANEIGPGDTVLLWITGDDAGIRAVLRIDGVPQVMPELDHEQRYWLAGRDTEERRRVLCTITHRNVNLERSRLRDVPGLENLSLFKGFQQATNFRITPMEGEILMRLAEEI